MSTDPLWAATVPDTARSAPGHAPAVAPARAPAPTTDPDVATTPARTEQMPVTDAPAPLARPSAERGRPRLWLRVVMAAAALAASYAAISVYQVWSTGRDSQARPVDAIVVLGAAQYDGRPSPQLEARLDEVVRLWPQGYASLVVVTGGKQPDDRFTAAEASARYLIDHGVPETAIVFENAGATTFESLESTAAILAERGLDRVLLVTDPFHSLRSRLIAEEVGMEAYVAPTTTSVVAGPRSAMLHLREGAGVAVGRLIGFARLSGLTG
ncbi:hypothetical protein BH23ACT3_BH23ACT3_19300 [soil metagenome]